MLPRVKLLFSPQVLLIPNILSQKRTLNQYSNS